MDNETRTTLILPANLAAMVDDYWHIRRLNTRNEAIRELLRVAFDTGVAEATIQLHAQPTIYQNSNGETVVYDKRGRPHAAPRNAQPAKEQRRG